MTDDVEAAELTRAMPPLYWFRDFHRVVDTTLTIEGYFAHRPEVSRDQINFEIDDESVTPEFVHNARVDTSFWFLPTQNRSGFVIKTPRKADDRPVKLTVRLQDTSQDRSIETSLWQFNKLTNLGPTPPIENIERVSGKGASSYNYFNNGYSDFRRFTNIANRHGLSLSDGSVSVLDWGSGCGRLTRHFLKYGRGRILGIDIDPDNIHWSKENLNAESFDIVPLRPPTTLKSANFDLVVANSVLSHLTLPSAREWLLEIKRVLKPNGLALLSYHGDLSSVSMFSRAKRMYDSVQATGFNADLKAGELDAFIGDQEYYRQTFMTDAFARGLMGEAFSVEEQVIGVVSRYQNVAVLRP